MARCEGCGDGAKTALIGLTLGAVVALPVAGALKKLAQASNLVAYGTGAGLGLITFGATAIVRRKNIDAAPKPDAPKPPAEENKIKARLEALGMGDIDVTDDLAAVSNAIVAAYTKEEVKELAPEALTLRGGAKVTAYQERPLALIVFTKDELEVLEAAHIDAKLADYQEVEGHWFNQADAAAWAAQPAPDTPATKLVEALQALGCNITVRADFDPADEAHRAEVSVKIAAGADALPDQKEYVVNSDQRAYSRPGWETVVYSEEQLANPTADMIKPNMGMTKFHNEKFGALYISFDGDIDTVEDPTSWQYKLSQQVNERQRLRQYIATHEGDISQEAVRAEISAAILKARYPRGEERPMRIQVNDQHWVGTNICPIDGVVFSEEQLRGDFAALVVTTHASYTTTPIFLSTEQWDEVRTALDLDADDGIPVERLTLFEEGPPPVDWRANLVALGIPGGQLLDKDASAAPAFSMILYRHLGGDNQPDEMFARFATGEFRGGKGAPGRFTNVPEGFALTRAELESMSEAQLRAKFEADKPDHVRITLVNSGLVGDNKVVFFMTPANASAYLASRGIIFADEEVASGALEITFGTKGVVKRWAKDTLRWTGTLDIGGERQINIDTEGWKIVPKRVRA